MISIKEEINLMKPVINTKDIREYLAMLAARNIPKKQMQQIFEKRGYKITYGQLLYYLKTKPITPEEIANHKKAI